MDTCFLIFFLSPPESTTNMDSWILTSGENQTDARQFFVLCTHACEGSERDHNLPLYCKAENASSSKDWAHYSANIHILNVFKRTLMNSSYFAVENT